MIEAQVLEFIRANPESRRRDIVRGTGLTRRQVESATTQLERKRLVTVYRGASFNYYTRCDPVKDAFLAWCLAA